MTNMMTGDRQAFMSTLADVVRRDQSRRERRKKIGKACGYVLVAFGLWAFRAWMFMLAVGVIHAVWLPRVPTLGYWWAGVIGWLLRAGLAVTTATGKTNKKTNDR